MATSTVLFLGSLLVLLSCLHSSNADKQRHHRKLHSENPCSSQSPDSAVNVIHTTATGKNSTLHYIISTVGIPTFLVAKTQPDVNVTFHCKKLQTAEWKAIEFTQKPDYVYALLLNRVLEYNDIDDEANLTGIPNNETFWNKHNLSSLPWSDFNATSDLKDNVIVLQVDTSSEKLQFLTNGSLSFRFKIHGSDGRADDLPHLSYTPDSGLFDFVLDRVNTTFNNSRFALEMAFVTTDKNSSRMGIQISKSIDDEHTPGVFELYDWVSNKKNESRGSYVQWKPVCYTLPKRAITAITKAKNYDITSNISKEDLGNERSLAYVYFGDDMYSSHVALTMTNVSFGLSKDKFYTLNNYSVWSAGLGFGKPPADTISTTIIIVILCGLGIPAALIIFGGIAVCVKKRKDRYKGYEDLSENDGVVNT